MGVDYYGNLVWPVGLELYNNKVVYSILCGCSLYLEGNHVSFVSTRACMSLECVKNVVYNGLIGWFFQFCISYNIDHLFLGDNQTCIYKNYVEQVCNISPKLGWVLGGLGLGWMHIVLQSINPSQKMFRPLPSLGKILRSKGHPQIFVGHFERRFFFEEGGKLQNLISKR